VERRKYKGKTSPQLVQYLLPMKINFFKIS